MQRAGELLILSSEHAYTIRAFALSLNICTLRYTCHLPGSVKTMIISLLVVMIAVQLISKRGLWESQSRVIPSWHFSSSWPPFLKTIIFQMGGNMGLSMSSAILDPLTFQFTLCQAGVRYDLSVAHVLLWLIIRVALKWINPYKVIENIKINKMVRHLMSTYRKLVSSISSYY